MDGALIVIAIIVTIFIAVIGTEYATALGLTFLLLITITMVTMSQEQVTETMGTLAQQELTGTLELPIELFPFPVIIVNLDRKPERYQYVADQLDKLNITNYYRWSATDGFNTTAEQFMQEGMTQEFAERKGLPGCASSHIRVWKHIVEQNMNWVLVVEDDAHFHPDFLQLFAAYWNSVPIDAKIVFPGYCCGGDLDSKTRVVKRSVMCTHSYLLSKTGAQYLLDNLFPIDNPIDIVIAEHFRHRNGCYIFNPNVTINGVCPNDYKNQNGGKCTFDGIIYQNQEEQGTTIKSLETLFDR